MHCGKIVFVRQRTIEDADVICLLTSVNLLDFLWRQTHAEDYWDATMPPHAEVMVSVASGDQASVDVATEAQLDPNILAFDGFLMLFFYMDNVSKPTRLPGKEGLELFV